MDKPPVSDPLSDEELAAEARAGSRSSFEELVHRYSLRLFHFLRPRIGTDQDTEDLVQETFLKVYRNIHRFDINYKFSTWLYTIAVRLAIGFYRKNRSEEPTPESAGAWADPHDTMIREQESQNLWNTAKTLQPNLYQALWLRYMEDLSLKEIAGVMKKNQVHVRVLLHRARLQLGKRLNPDGEVKSNKKKMPTEHTENTEAASPHAGAPYCITRGLGIRSNVICPPGRAKRVPAPRGGL